MATLTIPDKNVVIDDFAKISQFLDERGIFIEKWETPHKLDDDSSQQEILAAYDHKLKPFMDKHGFQSADVINIHPQTEGLETLSQKFLKEHTHSEDEVRFFVDGKGVFWFHIDDEVFHVTCLSGDFLSVPAGVKHWFDFSPENYVKAIRIFTSTEGWTPHYTESGVERKYL